MIAVLPQTSWSNTGRLNIHEKYPVLEAENKVWLGTPDGLYQYDSEADSYKRFVIPVKSVNQNIRHLYYNDEWLWCILDSSLAAMHIRLNEWLVFNEKNGLPSSVVNGLDFTDDYIWAATENGAARYDLLIEEWEVYDQSHGIPQGPVKDILVDDENVWMVFEYGLSEYHPDYEKWRHYHIEVDTTAKIRRGFFLTDELWLVSEKGLVRFDTELRTQQIFSLPYLDSSNLIELMTEDELIWVFSKSGMNYYDQESEVWREFEGNSYLKNSVLVNSYVDQAEIWILTDQNVLVWDRAEKSWETLDYSSGLSGSSFHSAYVNSGLTFLMNPQNFDYRLSAEENWQKYTIQKSSGKAGASGKQIFKNLFDNEEGGYIGLGKYKLGFEGSRITRIYDREQQYDSDGNAGDAEVVTGNRLDVKTQLSLGKSRNISGFYNNIDYSETMYGIRYRSREEDYLREFNWGDYRLDPSNVPFGETASMFGSNIWLQAGEKTERFKRSMVSLKAYTGERRSQKTYEHYEGALRQFSVSVSDVSYARNQFYEIPGLSMLNTPEDIEIFVDDFTSSNNTPNTLISETIVGITGDFDKLAVTQDYYFYEKMNAVRLTGYYNSTATIVIRYTYNNQTFEEILQQDGIISTAHKNVYYMNAQTIIPYSFRLDIRDLSGQAAGLSDFGLDDNGDGFVDSNWIDYENGILFFPQAEPFPVAVYDTEDAQSSYKLEASYQTEFSLIQLEHKNLVRGTEVVKLDGVTAEGGNTYVLDYTNGTLVFVKDGIITPETRIEIEYEYYLPDEYSQLHNVAVNYSPSDNISVTAEWVNFENVGDSTTNLIKTHAELRKKVGDFDVKFTPGAAYQTEENALTAYQMEGVVSSSWMRFQSQYQSYDQDYENLYLPQSSVGQVKENLEINSSIDVHKNVRINGSWTDTKGFSADDSSAELTDKNGSVSALFHHQTLPGYEISYSNTQTDTDTSSIKKRFFKHKLEYQLPQKLLDYLPIKGLKLEGNLKTGKREGQEIAASDQQKFYQSNFRINANLGEQFQSSLLYRKNDFEDNSNAASQDKHILTSERILFNLSHEKWKLLQTNLRIENILDTYDYPVDDEFDLNSNQYTQLNFRLSPGVLWDELSPLFFEYNLNHSLYASGTSDGDKSSYLWSALPGGQTDFSASQHLKTHYIKNEIRPNPNIYVYSLYEWNNQENSYGLSSLNTNYWRLSEKFDVKLGFNTRVSLQYKQYYSNLGNGETTSYYEPSVWIERRWTSNLQNILYAAYRNTDDFGRYIKDYTHKLDGRYDIIFRKKDFLKMRRMELQQSFSGGQKQTSGYNIDNSYYLGSSTSFDLYPIHSLLLRMQLNLNRTVNLEDNTISYITTDLNLKLSLKL